MGTYSYADGSKYVGPWVNDEKSGNNGHFVWSDKDEYKGIFNHGECVAGNSQNPSKLQKFNHDKGCLDDPVDIV